MMKRRRLFAGLTLIGSLVGGATTIALTATVATATLAGATTPITPDPSTPITVPVGGSPAAVGVSVISNANEPQLVYVQNAADGSVSVISPNTNAIVASIPAHDSGCPGQIGVDPATEKIFVAQPCPDKLSIIDGFGGELTGVSLIGGSPVGVAVSHPTNGVGTVFVSVDEINPGSGQPTGTYNGIELLNEPNDVVTQATSTGATAPGEIAWDAANSTLYGTAPGSDEVLVFDSSGNEVATIPLASGSDPVALAVDPNNDNIYVADAGTNQLSVISGADCNSTSPGGCSTTPPTVNVDSGPDAVAVDSTTGKVFVAAGTADEMDVVSVASNAVIASYATGTDPDGIGVLTQYVGTSSPNDVDAVYVANAGSNTVSVIHADTFAPQGTPPVGSAPVSVAVDSLTGDSYVANSGDNTVSIIDGETHTVTGTISVGSNPSSVAIDESTDTVYVADSGDGTVDVIDGAAIDGAVTASVLTSVTVGGDPVALAFDPANSNLYVVNDGSPGPGVQVIPTAQCNSDNTSTCAVSPSVITVGSDPDTIAVDPGSDAVYVGNLLGDSVSVINGANDTVTSTVGVAGGPDSIAVDTATGLLYVADAIDGVSTINVFDPTSGTFVGSMNLGAPLYIDALAVDPLTGALYAVNGGNDIIAVFDVATEVRITSIDVPCPSGDCVLQDVAADPLGSQGLFVADNGEADNVAIYNGEQSTAASQTVNVAPENDGVILNWTSTTSNGGTGINNVDLSVEPISGPLAGSPAKNTTLTTGTSSAIVGTLENGTEYAITITLLNDIGAGAPAGVDAVVGLPGTASDVEAVPGTSAATVSWQAAPANGSAVSSYTVTAVDLTNSGRGGQQVTTTSSPATVPGLTDGDLYVFYVAATNVVGPGLASALSNPVTPAAPPGTPAIGAVTALNGAASVSFAPAASSGGSAVTSYTVTATDRTNAANGGQSASGAASPILVSGLENGDSYTFSVTASNAIGTSSASAPSSVVVPAGPPGAPTFVTAAGGDAVATVSWIASVANGSPVTAYKVYPYVGTTPQPGLVVTVPGNVTRATMKGLTNGVTYVLFVVATNARGSSSPTPTAAPVTPEREKPVVALHVPATGAIFGQEQKTQLTVQIGPAALATAPQKVNIYDGRVLVCTVTVFKSGSGTCSPAAKAIPVGKAALVAQYSGNSYLLPADSATETLVVRG
jgi:YVTN family beta-propeller protein